MFTTYTLHTTHYTLHYTTHYTLQSTHHRVHTTQYTVHTTQYTVHSTHYTLHYTLHTTHYTVHSTHYTTPHTTLHYSLTAMKRTSSSLSEGCRGGACCSCECATAPLVKNPLASLSHSEFSCKNDCSTRWRASSSLPLSAGAVVSGRVRWWCW